MNTNDEAKESVSPETQAPRKEAPERVKLPKVTTGIKAGPNRRK